MSKRITIGVLVALLIVTGAIVFRQKSQSTSKESLTPVAVRLKWINQAQFAGFYIAADKGYYRQEGLDVKLNPGGVDFPAIQMVAGGGEQFGVTGADQLLLAREKNVPVTAVAVIYRKSPFVLFSLKQSGITKPQDFVGQKIGVKLGGNEELTYRAMMKAAGIDTSKVTEVPVKYDMTPLFSGQVAVWPGYAINEPLVAEEQGHPVNVIWPTDYGVSLYADTIFTTDAMVQNHPDVVAGFVRATLHGWQYALDHPEEAIQVDLKYGDQLNHDHELRMLQASAPLIRPDGEPLGWMEVSKWTDMQQLLLDQGLVKQPVDISKVFTNKFINAPQQSK